VRLSPRTRLALLSCVLAMSVLLPGCAAKAPLQVLAPECPRPPQAPQELMVPPQGTPLIDSFESYRDATRPESN
jgi:hypothetical protein